MNLQVLVSTMNQQDYSLMGKMNLQSDAIIINQCHENNICEFKYKGHTIKFISLAERGVGLSRNTALMRTTSDVCIFADDDVRYIDNYQKLILEAFRTNPKADIILFNVLSTNSERPSFKITNHHKLKLYNSLKYGAVRIAARTEKLRQANISFSLLFGGGAKYSSGEDSLFIADCIKRGLKVYTDPQIIGYVSQESSSWFEGYNDKYFRDLGTFYAFLSKRISLLLCVQFAIRHRKLFKRDKTIIEVIKLMMEGVKERNI